jgi:hypothetical protein
MKGVSKYGSEHSTFSAHFSTLASYVVWKDAYDYQSMILSNLIKIMIVIF